MMQNPLFPSSAQGQDPAGSNPPLPDYLQTRPVQAAPAQSAPVPVQWQPSVPAPAAPVVPANPMTPAPAQPSGTDLTIARTRPQPVQPQKSDDPNRNAAADLIRQKLDAIYATEPDAQAETAHIQAAGPAATLSKHQEYMQMLNESGKPWAAIQNDWHAYYMSLPDDEKHQVWQEFYSSGTQQTFMPGAQPTAQPLMPQATVPTPVHVDPVPSSPWPPASLQQQPTSPFATGYFAQQAQDATTPTTPDTAHDDQPVVSAAPGQQILPESRATNLATVADIKQRVLDKVNAGGKIKGKQHLQSLAFGVMSGTVAVLFFLLLFFNEVVIAPFIQPSRQATETPIIVDTASAAVGKEPKVIIPKINVEIPVDYTQTTTNEDTLQKALNNGTIHYPTTARPGQAGNTAIFGHSSNNILNPGKYKFAFLMLHKLTTGDTFYLTYEGKAYAYEVISMRVVEPTEISVLGPVPNETSTATLITCDPPGTSLKRLVVVGRQTSPDPAGNTAPATNPPNVPVQAATTTQIPGNGPTLWSRMWNSVF